MPLDAIFLSHLSAELHGALATSRVDKIHMPARDEIVMALRSPQGNCRLLVSANHGSARICIIGEARENPTTPPVFCMLLRKHLSGARLIGIRQEPYERVVYLIFEGMGELGDIEQKQLVLEIMGRSSNIILLDGASKVLAATSYIDISEEKSRQLIAGVPYELPKKQDKTNPIDGYEAVRKYILSANSDTLAWQYLIDGIVGLSPLIARECVCRTAKATDMKISALSGSEKEKLADAVTGMLKGDSAVPYLIKDTDGLPVDFTFTDVAQYEGRYFTEEYNGYSELLDGFYAARDKAARAKQRTAALTKLVANSIERISKKMSHQHLELEDFANRDRFRVYGELLTAALHSITRGAPYAELQNYYEDGSPVVKIPLDITKSPSANAQRYFKKYQKAKTGERILKEQIEKGAAELDYLATVQVSLAQAENERDIAEIRDELISQGYLAKPKRQGTARPQKRPAGEPLKFVSKDGFVILIGKNNIQNDRLVATHDKSDWWLHVLGGAGSHVIVEARGQTVPNSTLEEAAVLAARHSKMADEKNVPVTYTFLRDVKKPAGSKPGFVIFTTSKTAYVTPKKDDAM